MEIIESMILTHYFGVGGVNYYFLTIPVTISLSLYIFSYNNESSNAMISKIGSMTVGIYVIHPFIMSFMSWLIEFSKMNFILNNFLWRLLYTPLVFLLSLVAYMFLDRYKSKLSLNQ